MAIHKMEDENDRSSVTEWARGPSRELAAALLSPGKQISTFCAGMTRRWLQRTLLLKGLRR